MVIVAIFLHLLSWSWRIAYCCRIRCFFCPTTSATWL